MNAEASAPRPSISVPESIAMMVGIVVGIGIFKTPPIVASNVGSEAAFLGAWVLGGLVTLIGALCYAELAAAHPNAGGEYHFLQRALGRFPAVLFGWARGTVIQTGAIAAVGFVFGDYVNALLPLGTHGAALYAALAIVVFTALNFVGSPPSQRMQLLFTALTVAALLAVAVAGLLLSGAARAPAAAQAGASSGAFGLAMILVLLTYGGWNEAAYLSGEMRNVQRNMAVVLLGGTAILVVLYVVVNAAFLSAFGLEGLRGTNAVGAEMMRLVVGDAGAVVLTLIVSGAALSTLNATIFTGARVYYALGRDIPAIGRLARWDERGHNPKSAILLQGMIAVALVVLGAATRDGFQAMVDYTAPVFWAFLFLVGVSLFVLRHREPDTPRPFQVPLYPVTPALFCLTCLYMLYSSIAYTGLGALVGILVVLAGLPLLLLARTPPAATPALAPGPR